MKTKLRRLLITVTLAAGLRPAPAQVSTPSIFQAGNQTVLVWPATATNYLLQTSTNLESTNWATVTNWVNVTAVAVTNVPPLAFFRLASNPVPAGMALVPAGAFILGDTLDNERDAVPVSVTVSPFYADTNLVDYLQWLTVYVYATSHKYGFDNGGGGKGAIHPVQTVNWYDAVKWCNARSQQAGLTPVYYTDVSLTQVYTNGQETPYANWSANGYRLPTEAEWEKAARGGLAGQRFPWGNTISESQADYFSTNLWNYDLGPRGYNTNYDTGQIPYTSPVGSFAPNGYGLYDMAGNVEEWCWDWYAPTYAGGTDPRGPASGSQRVFRGGDCLNQAYSARCATRGYAAPAIASVNVGFRCVRSF